jgi:ABC-type branched-subunit amino acid transport system ATPase component
MSGRPPVLQARDLVAGYDEVPILRGLALTVPAGAVVSVIGPNGAGKSTLLKAVYGLLRPTSGSVVFQDGEAAHELRGRKPHEITALGLNYVPQLDNVFPGLTVLENLEIGGYLRRATLARRLAAVWAAFPQLHARRRDRAGSLSGGQRQMLALARALVTEPRLLLLDEPSAGLAPAAVDELFAKLEEIRATGVALLIVEQNARRSLAMSDYGYVLDAGRNAHEGPGGELLSDNRVVELYLGGRGVRA